MKLIESITQSDLNLFTLASKKLKDFFPIVAENRLFVFLLGFEAVSLPLGPLLCCVAGTEIQR